MKAISPDVEPPSKLLLLAEWRALGELGLYAAARPFLGMAPKGSGPVLVLPGFLANDFSTRPLRAFLHKQGHSPSGWELGRNLGPRDNLAGRLMRTLEDLADKHGQRIALVGWSLGGIYARQMAKKRPDLVNRVISLGSPFRGGPEGTNSRRLYEWVTGQKADREITFLGHSLKEDPPVPFTAIYSRSDGVCAWQCCVTDATDNAENIEVFGSHCGLGHNPSVLYAVADRLASTEFRKFQPPAGLNGLFPRPASARAA
jgi:hypothetical protein